MQKDFQEHLRRLGVKYPEIYNELDTVLKICITADNGIYFTKKLAQRGYIIDQIQLFSYRSLSFEICYLYCEIMSKLNATMFKAKINEDISILYDIDMLYVQVAFLYERRFKLRLIGGLDERARPNGKPVLAYRGRAYHGMLPMMQNYLIGGVVNQLNEAYKGSDTEFETFWTPKRNDFQNPLELLQKLDEYLYKYRLDSESYKNNLIFSLSEQETTLDTFESIIASTK